MSIQLCFHLEINKAAIGISKARQDWEVDRGKGTLIAVLDALIIKPDHSSGADQTKRELRKAM